MTGARRRRPALAWAAALAASTATAAPGAPTPAPIPAPATATAGATPTARAPAAPGPISLRSPDLRAELDPATLATRVRRAAGPWVPVSAPLPPRNVADLLRPALDRVRFRWPDEDLTVEVVARPDHLTLTFSTTTPRTVTWPRLEPDPAFHAWSVPQHEGRWIPARHPGWAGFLDGRDESLTAELSMPVLGRLSGGTVLTLLALDPLIPRLRWTRQGDAPAADLEHRLRPARGEATSRLQVHLGPGDALEPAQVYRRHLEATGRFVAFAEKVRQTPRAARLIGATHAYLHGLGPLTAADVRRWPALTKALARAEAGPLAEARAGFSPEAAQALADSQQWVGAHARRTLAAALGAWVTTAAADPAQGRSPTWPTPRARALVAALPGAFHPPEAWGGACSVPFLRRLQAAGFDRLCLTLGTLSGLDGRPDVVAEADRLGFLLGPYDSYHSMHAPGAAGTWETAQLGADAFHNRAIHGPDGQPRPGFMRRGRLLAPALGTDLVAARVDARLPAHPFRQWFVDCDAFGEFYDDYTPGRPSTRAQGLAARLARLAWFPSQRGLVIGSEGGSAVAASVLHYAHGMTTPVMAWGDPDLFEDQSSPHFMGRWFPPEAPDRLVRPTTAKPALVPFFFDPRFRLPLYQAALHDSLVTTHHWEFSSLKFSDQVETQALVEGLYVVPGLFHLTPDLLDTQGEALAARHRRFARLHRRLWRHRPVAFEALDPDRLVQRLTWSDGSVLTANFSPRPYLHEGERLPARSLIERLAGADGSRER